MQEKTRSSAGEFVLIYSYQPLHLPHDFATYNTSATPFWAVTQQNELLVFVSSDKRS